MVCQLVSRILFPSDKSEGLLSFILSTYPLRPPLQAIGRATLWKFRENRHRNIFGLSAPEVYHSPASLPASVSSYLTFSPLPRQVGAVSFSVALSVSKQLLVLIPRFRRAGCSLLSGLSFLPPKRKDDRTTDLPKEQFVDAKID